jgi:predicted O-methyltransferase YrrM
MPQHREKQVNPNWIRNEQYHESFVIDQDEALTFALKNSKEKGLPPIAVSAGEGKLLHLIAKSIGAKRVLEIGTLGG